MRRKEEDRSRDIDECKEKIQKLLREYNCELCTTYDYSNIYMRDKDTDERRSLE